MQMHCECGQRIDVHVGVRWSYYVSGNLVSDCPQCGEALDVDALLTKRDWQAEVEYQARQKRLASQDFSGVPF